ncbi:MAG: sortase [Chloroflexi bacterium]|nr:sortase [Chloroflexota bacterium]
MVWGPVEAVIADGYLNGRLGLAMKLVPAIMLLLVAGACSNSAMFKSSRATPTATATLVPPAPTYAAAAQSFAEAKPKTTPVAVRSLRPLRPTHITIPRIGVDSPVVEIDTRYDDSGALVWETAAYAVGHYSRTAKPGEPGNMVLSGHISSRAAGAVFKRLPEIAVGDGVIVFTTESSYFYKVRSVWVVEPDEVKVMESTGEHVVTLITCVPDGIYTQRLVVVAVPQ